MHAFDRNLGLGPGAGNAGTGKTARVQVWVGPGLGRALARPVSCTCDSNECRPFGCDSNGAGPCHVPVSRTVQASLKRCRPHSERCRPDSIAAGLHLLLERCRPFWLLRVNWMATKALEGWRLVRVNRTATRRPPLIAILGGRELLGTRRRVCHPGRSPLIIEEQLGTWSSAILWSYSSRVRLPCCPFSERE